MTLFVQPRFPRLCVLPVGRTEVEKMMLPGRTDVEKMMLGLRQVFWEGESLALCVCSLY